jgi:site-specific recombinase XerD
MLRHACGFKLANDGHDTRAIQAYLGHRSIMSTNEEPRPEALFDRGPGQ